MNHVNKMIDGKDYFVCNLPYQLSAHHGLLTKKRITEILEDENMSDMSFTMEFQAMFYKETDTSYFKSKDILPSRVLEYAWYPPTQEQYAIDKNKEKKSYWLPKILNNELRVLSCDIALMDSKNGKNNDNAVFTFFRCLPKNGTYISQVLHIENHEGWKVKQLTLQIKRLFYDGQCDYIVLDVAGKYLPQYMVTYMCN
ncbi:MAG: hypothetical protein RSA18_04825 [Bacilli bacterium]